MLKHSFILFVVMAFVSCSNNNQKPAIDNKGTEMESSAMDNHDQFKAEMVVNKTDFACGMPVSAGISDTAQFEGKAYGFCSQECKSEFQKAPSKYLAPKQ